VFARRRRASVRAIETATITTSNKQRGSVCRFSGWPTAGFCLTHRSTNLSEMQRKQTIEKPVRIHPIWMRWSATKTRSHARWPFVMVPRPEKANTIDFRQLPKTIFQQQMTSPLEIGRYAYDLDGMGCSEQTRRRAEWSLSWSRGSKRLNQYRFC
jgi:hypothetical protein